MMLLTHVTRRSAAIRSLMQAVQFRTWSAAQLWHEVCAAPGAGPLG